MHNKAQQFAADGRRTPFTWLLRRHSKVAAVLRVKCLAPAFFGLVFGRGLAVVFGQNTALGLAAVFAANLVFGSRGNPA